MACGCKNKKRSAKVSKTVKSGSVNLNKPKSTKEELRLELIRRIRQKQGN